MSEPARPHVPNVLAQRYAAEDLVRIWSPEHKVVLERQLWIAVLRAQQRARRRRTRRGRRGLRSSARPGRPRLDRGAGAGHAARREGAHRGVQRARGSRAHPQGDDLARPHRERRAAADALVAGAGARPRGRDPGPAGPARDRARVARDGRPHAQRGRAGDDAREAVRHGRRRDARRARPPRGADRALPAARHQGPDGHLAGHARPARRVAPSGSPSSRSGSPRTWASTAC